MAEKNTIIINPKDQYLRDLAWIDPVTGKIPEELIPPISGGIDILYNGNVIEKNAQEINFQGNFVQVNKTGEGKVNILVAENANPSNFGTQDGVTDARLTRTPAADNSYTLTSPTAEGNPFKLGGLTPGQPYSKCIANNTTQLVYTVTQTMYLATNATTLSVKLLDADNVGELLTGSFVLDGNGTKTDGTITCVISQFQANTGDGQNGYSCKLVITIPLVASLPGGGKFSVRMVHSNNGVNYPFANDDLFLVKAVAPAIGTSNSNLTVALKTPVTKVISGIPYLDKTSIFTFGMTNITNINNNVRTNASSNIIVLTPTALGVPAKNYTGTILTSAPINLTNEYDATIASISEDISLSTGVVANGSVNTTAAITSVLSGTTRTTAFTARIWSNYGTPTDTNEPFGLETKRLKPDGITAWDSAESLLDNTGLQFFQNTLIYPTTNFTTVTVPSGGINYSGQTGARTFYRIYKIAGDNNARANGTFSITNLAEADIANPALQLEVQIVGGDGTWYDLKKAKGDGLGIRITSGYTLPNLRFSFPTGTTVVASSGLLLRVTMTNAYTKSINALNLTTLD